MPLDIRTLEPDNLAVIQLVAARMRATLVEVLGEERGEAMYTLDWLEDRVRFHLDSSQCDGQVLLASNGSGETVGHTIVRREADEAGQPFGLFSTVYVVPESRRSRAASRMLEAGENWMAERQLPYARTYTDHENTPLIRLFESHGYTIVQRQDDFVILHKELTPRT